MISGLFGTFRTKGGWGGNFKKRGQTITFGMSLVLWPQERKIARTVEEASAGGLTYCISAGWERTSNLTLLLPGSRARRTGNNSFSDCWLGQCPWYWKPTALGVSNLQSKQFENNFNSLDLIVYSVQLVLLMEELCMGICTYMWRFCTYTVFSHVMQGSLYQAE